MRFFGIILSLMILASCGTDMPRVVNETPKQQNAPAVNEEQFIGEERALEIALEKAGVSADNIFAKRVTLDFDDGVWHYEVEFKQGKYEYEADIKATDGSILSWDIDND